MSDMYSTAFINTDADLDAIVAGTPNAPVRGGALPLCTGDRQVRICAVAGACLDMPLAISARATLVALCRYDGCSACRRLSQCSLGAAGGGVLLIDEADSALPSPGIESERFKLPGKCLVSRVLYPNGKFPLASSVPRRILQRDRPCRRRFDLKAESVPRRTKLQTVEFAKCRSGKPLGD